MSVEPARWDDRDLLVPGCPVTGGPHVRNPTRPTFCSSCGQRIAGVTGIGQKRERPPRRSPRVVISAASELQREKVRDRRCIVSGKSPADPAHLWPRSLGGCDDPLCTVPLHRSVHRPFDEGKQDILPQLIAHGYIEEIQHAVGHANGDLIAVLERLTAGRWRMVGG